MEKGSLNNREFFDGKHRFEHRYRNNTVYFITSTCSRKFRASGSKETQGVFWKQFDKYCDEHQFDPWVCSLLNNHYHIVGYLHSGDNLPRFMRGLHGSVAKLVSDILPEKLRPFWGEKGRNSYFDGCLRNEKQYQGAYRYTLMQSVRHGLSEDYRKYPNTRVWRSLEEGLRLARERKVFLPEVPYQRYER
jgi:REP element-mobilizing transposase RayT